MIEEEEIHQHTLVIDNGSGLIKAGLGGEDAPRSCFDTVLGWPRHPGVGGIMLGAPKDNYVGNDAQEKRGLLSLKHPIQRGKIMDWEDMEKIWHHALYCELVVSPEEHPLLMTEIPATPRADKERMATMVFEVFNIPALYIGNQCVMSLFSTGRTTGTVVDSGESQTHCAPIWEGYCLPHHLGSMPIAGADVTNYLMGKLKGEGYPFSTHADRQQVKNIKETLCYTCANYDTEVAQCQVKQSYEREYKMPDGASIVLSQNRFETPEVMFTPSMLGMENVPGLHRLIHTCITKCDADIRREMFGNLVLAGGNTLFPRMDERVQKEVTALAPKGTPIKAVAFPERQYASWLGSSLLASLHTFPCMWVSKLEYDEYGASIIHRKF